MWLGLIILYPQRLIALGSLFIFVVLLIGNMWIIALWKERNS